MNRSSISRLLLLGTLLLATLPARAQDTVPGTLLSFDGVDDYARPDNGIFFGATYTLEGWFRTDGDAMTDAEDLVSGAVPGGTYILLEIRPSGQIRYLHRVPAGSVGGAEVLSPATVNDGAWHHVAAVMDGTEIRLYIDGVLEASAPETSAINDHVNVYLGSLGDGGGRFFGGAMDEMRLWNTARTEAEIREAMHRTLAGTETGLVAYWQLNEATGTTAADVLGGHDLTLQNGTAWAESDAPVAGGVSVTRTEAAGLVDFSAAGVTMNYSSQSGAQVTVTRLDAAPSNLPGTLITSFDSQYWSIARYGTGTFSAYVTFTVSEDLTVADENDPGRIKLFRRSSTAGLEPWGMVAAATGVDAEANTVTFSGVTSFGQFVLGRSGTPEPVSGTLLSFDGVDDRAHAATNLNLGATDITVEAWVRRGSTDTNDFFFSYGDVGEGRNQGLSMGYRPTNVFAFGFAGGNDLDTPVAYTDTGWHHWAGVYVRSTGERRLYRDGVLVASDVTGEPFEEVDAPELFLGRFFLQANSDFGGDLEELRVWNVARTEAEIREAMHRTMTGSESGLVAYWLFNEATGSTAADVVGGHDLTLQNGTAWAESDAPVAGGVSVTQTEADGPVDFSAAGVSMSYTAQGGASVTVTRLDAAPSSLPAGGSVETVLDGQYWIIERDGAGSFQADVTFTVAEDLSGDVAGRLLLFRRNSRAGEGEPWEQVTAADSLDAATGSVTFRGLTAFSQFVIVRAPAAQAVPGTRLTLDGVDDYVEIPDAPDFAFDRDSSYTVETWVRYTGTGGSGSGDGAIIEKWSGGAASYPFVLRVNRQEPGQVYCAVWDQSTGISSRSQGTLNDGAWHHLACVHDGAKRTLTLYVDGESQNVVSTASMGSLANTHPIYFGRRGGHLNEWFGGDLEEVRIWRAARTEEEVREGMHRTMTGTEPGLVAYWQFNEGAGTTAADIISGHDGTLNGGAAWAASDTPVGGGASATATAALGPVDFGGTGVTMDFTANTTADPITVTRLDLDPFDAPAAAALTFLGGRYWVVERFGTGAFTADLTFTLDGLTAGDAADPGRLKLLRRDSRAAGGTWSVVAHGLAADAVAGTVTFPGVTAFSQYAIARGSTPGTLAGSAADFDGTNHLDVGDLGDFGRRLKTATVSFWMKSVSAAPGSIMKVEVDPATPTAPVFAIEANRLLSAGCTVGDGAGATLFYVRDNAGRVLARHITADLYDGTWHHVAWVLTDATANQMTVYVDGVAQTLNGTCSQSPATFVDWGQPLFLGAASAAGTAEDHAAVSLDEVRFWTRARTDRQVREAMHHPLTGAEPGLVAYWTLNEGTGGTAADFVGGHDGTFAGGDGWTPATMPFGPGVFAQETEANGLIDFTGTDLLADYLSHSGSVVGVDRIDRTPENPPGGTAIEVFEGAHWLLTRYTGGPFSADLTFSTTGLTADDAAAPGRIKLFRRDGNSDGTWTLSASAAAVDEAAGTVTFAGVSKSGQYVLARGEEAPAVAGTALDFDGTDDVVRVPGLVLPNTFTLEMWINPQSGTDGRAFIARDLNGSGADLFNVGFYDGTLRVLLRNQTLPAGPRVTGQQHLAVVVEGTGTSSLVTVYRNGAQIARGTLAAVLDDDGTGADWILGGNETIAGTAGDFFDGTLDEVRIWTTARTAAQIRSSMHQVFGGTVDGLLAYWPFNEGTGSTAVDLVAGQDGTLAGGTGWVPSGAPIGEVVVATRTEAGGLVDFSGTGLQADYTAQDGATVYVSRVDGAPNTVPSGVTALDRQYWVLERFGTGAFTADLTFTPSEEVDGYDELLAGRLKLYRRSGGADGAWTPAAEAARVNPFTGTVTFRRISQPGQYLLVRSDARALVLDGVDDAATTTLAEDLDAWTLEAWVKADAAPSAAKTTALVERGTNYALFWDHPDSTARGAAALTIGGTQYTASFGTLEAGRWYHLAASYDGETLRAYRNGRLITRNEDPSGPPDADPATLVMGRHEATGEHFAGQLDEVRLWDVFRTGDRILADMQRTLAGDETGLAGYWRFDLAVGAGARDLTDGGHDAVFTGTPVLTASSVPADLVFPGDVAATDGVFEDKTEITWPALGLPDVTVTILRDGTQIAVASSDQTLYADTKGTRGTEHTYCLVLSAPFRTDSEPVCDAGRRILFAPDDVAATDSTLSDQVRVTWVDRSAFETGFNVYRDGSLLATVEAGVQSYSDTSAVGGMTHTYCVEAEDADGIPSEQGCDTGSRGFVLPPLAVSATDGQYPDRVVVTWTDQATDETGYRITRDGVVLDTLAAGTTSYDDLTPTSGVAHTYCVVTLNGSLASLPACDEGGIDILPVPGDVTATFDTFDDRVEIAWTDPVAFEDGFRIYRRDLAGTDSTVLTTTAANVRTFTDPDAEPGVDYRYCVTTLSTVSGSDVESVAACATGRRSRVLAPTGVAATDGDHENRVVLTWQNPATRAVLMNLYRVGTDTTLIKTVSSALTSYEDFGQASGTVYTYCVSAVNEEADETAKVCDEGHRLLAAPTSVAATDAESEDYVTVTWVDNSGIEQGYRIYRQAAGEPVRVLVGTTGASQASFQDFSGASGVTYTYSVVAFDAYSESDAGTDEGFRRLAAPTNVSAADGTTEDRIRITWIDNSRAEDGYRIYRRTLADEDSVVIAEVDKNLGVYEDATVVLGETYRYSVEAFDAHGTSAAGSDVGTTVLFAPETFNASDTYTGRVVLSWIDRSAVESGYQVLRDDILIATTTAGATTYIDSTAAGGVTYTYCVRATGGLAFSERACDAGTAMAGGPLPVLGDNGVAASDGAFDTRVQITWSNAGVDASQGLRIRRDGVEIDQVGAGATSYNDFDAAPGTLALYCVESVATGGTAGCDYGWTPPDGSISGRVASRLGGGIGDVAVCLDPNPNKALLFDGEGGTAVVQDVALPDSFTVELWVRPAALTGRQDLIALPNLRLGLTGAKLRLDYGTAGGIESADLMTPAWQHVALTVHQNRTGPTSDVKLYRDGILVLSTSFNQVLDTGTHDWSFGGDTTNGDYFSGRLDEVRWWSGVKPADALAASAAEARPLTGNEDGLLAYWPMDQGAGRIAGDRSGGNAHAAFAGGVYWTDDSAPLEACGTTDAEGNYTVAGLRYGSGTTFTVTPRLGARTFDPAFKKITLNTNSPVQNEVDFTDVSAFTIAGTVQFAGTTCPVPDADVYLDGVFKGKTESDGTYSIAADLGKRTVEVRLGEAGDAHPFTPASAAVTVEDDVRGVDFTDGKTRRLSGYFGGSCNTGIGTATIRIFTADGCFEKVIETSGNYAVDLPPQKYLVQVTGVETTNTQLKADIIAFFDQLGAQEVDLTAQADTLDLIYRAPLALAISGFPAPPASCPAGFNGGSLPAVPVLTQGDEYPLTISVVEDYGNGQTCPLAEGTLTVTDGLGNETVVTTLDLVDGQATYTTRAGDPDIFSGRTVEGVNRSFQKSLFVSAEVPGRSPVTETAWAVIDGMKARTATFVSATTGEIPLMILHDPPGSESYSYIEEGTTVCNSISHMKLSGGDTGVEFDLVLGFRSATGIGVAITSGAGLALRGRFVGGQDVTELDEDDDKRSLEICATTTQRISTSPDPTWVGEDLFAGVALNLIFAEADVLSVDDATCRLDLSETLATDFDTIEPFETVYVYGASHIEYSLIPDLQNLIDLAGDETSIEVFEGLDLSPWIGGPFKKISLPAKRLLLTEALAYWQGMLRRNEANKARALENSNLNRSFSGGATFEYTSTDVETETTFARTTRAYFESSGGVGSVITGGGYDQTGLIVYDARSETTRDTLATDEETVLMGYVLSDGDTGDFFSVDIGTDPEYGTPVFGTVSGRSSNPWEANTQRRDYPKLEISPPARFDVPPDESAIFNLSILNASESQERREYILDVLREFNPGSAVVGITGDPIGQERFLIEPGEAINVTLAVDRGPERYAYDSLALVLYPQKEFEIWQADPRQTFAMSDTVFFSVHFAAPCSEIAILRPKEHWIYDAAMAEAGDSLEVILYDFALQEADADPVEAIGLEYRLQGTPDWLPALQVQASTLDPDATSYVASWKPPADGLYDVRAFTSCPAGRAYSEPFPGTADTKRPEPFGTPQPADETLALGDDIAITFDEAIDCASVSTDGQYPNVQVSYLDGPEAGTALPVEAACDGRTIILEPGADAEDLEGRLLEARLRANVADGQGRPVVVTDAAGNGLAEDIAWTFTVRQSAFTFSPVNLDFELSRGTGALVVTSLVNGRAQPIDFTLPASFDLVLASDTTVKVPVAPSDTAGTLVAGGSRAIRMTLPDTLALGTYTGTLLATAFDAGGQRLGQAPFFLTTEVVCEAPAWEVDPAAFEHSMTLTAQLFFDGVASADTSDVLAAYVDGEVRGVGRVEEVTAGVYRAHLLVYSNVASGERVTFQAWDDSACMRYAETSKRLVFERGAVHGSFSQPVAIQAPPVIDEQAIPLAAGWTWFSLNKHPDDTDVHAVLNGLTAVEGDLVKSQAAFSLYDDRFGWVGTLGTLDAGPAYLIHLQQSNSLTVTGLAADPAAEPIGLVPGWNWVGYLPDVPMDVNTALASLGTTATPGDVIKSQFAFAQYADATLGWVGSLTTMEPGLGYQIQVADAGTLTYPAAPAARVAAPPTRVMVVDRTAPPRALPPDTKTDAGAGPAARVAGLADAPRPSTAAADAPAEAAPDPAAPDWTLDPKAYPFSMSLVAELVVDDLPLASPDARLGLFAGDELRGLGQVRTVPGLDRALVFALAYGDEPAELTARLYDPLQGEVLEAGTVAFEPDATLGTPAEPLALRATTETAEDLPTVFALAPAYPNPFNPATSLRYDLPQPEHVRLEVYDVIGRRVATLVDARQKAGRYEVHFDARHLASGVYVYRLRAGDFVQTRKMVLLK